MNIIDFQSVCGQRIMIQAPSLLTAKEILKMRKFIDFLEKNYLITYPAENKDVPQFEEDVPVEGVSENKYSTGKEEGK